MRIFRRRMPPRRSRRRRWRVVLFVLLLALILLLRLRYLPAVQRVVSMQVDNETSNLINDAVDAYLNETKLTYLDLVTLDKDSSGEVSAMQLNMPEANRMKSRILEEISQRIPDMDSQSLRIPLGNVLMPALFSGHGGYLPVKVVALRGANAELESDFSQAGINQTLHRLNLMVSVELLLLTPAGFLESEVSTSVAVAQTVIVGDVPNLLMTGE